MLSTSGAVQSWPLEKYAKFIATGEDGEQTQNQGSWKQFSSTEDKLSSFALQVSLVESNLVVSDGKVIHESFSLFSAKKWLKAVVKGDSMLFLYRMNNDCRRFRIKFNKSPDRSAMGNCRHFVSEVSSRIPVREMLVSTESDSQIPIEDSQLISPDSQHTVRGAAGSTSCGSASSGLTLPELANKVTSLESRVDALQNVGHIAVPQDQLSLMIRLCLADSNFPAFVTAVERELKNLTSPQ